MMFENSPIEGEMKKKFEQEIGAYESLCEVFADVPDLDTTDKISIAYVIEDVHKKDPDHWIEDIETFKNDLLAAKKEGGDPDLTWKMAQEVFHRYDSLLEQTTLESNDPVTKNNISSLRNILKEDFGVQRTMHDVKKRVPLGGISSKHVPQWFSFVV